MILKELLDVIRRKESAHFYIALLDDIVEDFKPYTYRRILHEELYKREVYEMWNPCPDKYGFNTYWFILRGKDDYTKH